MLESVYLTSAEKRAFLQEFAGAMMNAMQEHRKKDTKERISTAKKTFEKEREEALEKVRLIMRQFPSGIQAEAQPKIKMQPVKAAGESITLNGSIDSLLNDAEIRIIECSEGIVKVDGNIGMKEAEFKLNEREIKDIIKRFAEKAKIPFTEGLFKARIGNLTINAVVSDMIGSRFLITKS